MGRPGGPKHNKNLFFNNFTFATFRISGPTLDSTWAPLDLSWAILVPSWAPLVVSWASLGVLRGPLGGLWGSKGPSWSPLDPSGRSLGAILRVLCAGAGPPGAVMGHFGAPRRPPSSNFGEFSIHFRYNFCSLYHFRLILSSFVVHFVSIFKWKRLGRPGTSQ